MAELIAFVAFVCFMVCESNGGRIAVILNAVTFYLISVI